jgi:predicted restriction endonuclease
MCLLAGLLMLPVILVLRIQPEPSYIFGQLVQRQAAHNFQLRQTEVHYAVQYGYPGAPIQDTRYIPDDLRRAVLQRDNYRCQYCGSTASLELDHIIPRSQGGATSYKNLQVLCQGGSQRKGAW